MVGGPEEEVEYETHNAPRGQNTPPPGTRPGVLKEPGAQEATVTVGYVAAAGAPLLAQLVLDAPVPQMVDTVLEFFRALDKPDDELVIAVPKISTDRVSQRLVERRLPQMVEQLVEVPTVVSYFSLLQRKAKKKEEEEMEKRVAKHTAVQSEAAERLCNGRGFCWSRRARGERGRRGERGGRLVPPPAPLVASLVVDSGSGVFAMLVLLVLVHLVLCSLWLMTGPCCSATRPVWTRRTVFSSWLWHWHMQCWFCWFRSSRCVPFCHGQALMLRIMDSIHQKDCYSVGWFYW